jgi:membrane fusion protein (multidrug efflux system)
LNAPHRSLLLGLLSLAGVAAGCGEKKAAPPAPPPPTVYVTTVARRDVPLFIEAVGALDGYVNAEIRARVRGFLRSQNYKDGAPVKAGDLLFTIEPTEYSAAVSSAQANLERARVARDRNKIQVERNQGLLKSGMISQQDYDNAAAGLADTDAQIQSNQALLQSAGLNLSYTTLRSPITGVAGLALVRVGNLVGQDGPTLLTTVSQIDPIRVNFALSEIDYVKYPERFQHLENRDLAWFGKQAPLLDSKGVTDSGDPGVEIVLADGSAYPHKGLIVSTNRQIDATTGTIQLQALAANPDGLLRPGQYGRVRIRRRDAGDNVLVVPDKALVAVQGQYSVAVVGPDNKVQLRRVELGPSAKGLQIIEKGIAEGDRVVVEGVQKAADGATVDPKPAPDAARASSGAPPAAGASAAKN